MRFLWPTRLNDNPSGFTRFGRVLHWIATGFFVIAGGACLVGAAVGAYQHLTGYVEYGYYGTPYSPGLNTLGLSAALFALVFLTYMAGRALRYIFSGE